jgi:methyl-accepting chemotaxis protein
VNHSLLEINEITQQNASLVEEVTHTSTSIIDSVKGVEERLLNFRLKASDSVTSLPPANEVDEHETFAEETVATDEGADDETLLTDTDKTA